MRDSFETAFERIWRGQADSAGSTAYPHRRQGGAGRVLRGYAKISADRRAVLAESWKKPWPLPVLARCVKLFEAKFHPSTGAARQEEGVRDLGFAARSSAGSRAMRRRECLGR